MDNTRTRLLLVANIQNDENSKRYLAKIEDFVKKDPKCWDVIVDLGGQYFFNLIKNNASSADFNQYFGIFQNITRYIPYSVVVNDISILKGTIGVENKKNIFFNTYSAQIRYLQNEKITKENTKIGEELFTQCENELVTSRIVLTNTPFYCSSNEDSCMSLAKQNRDNYLTVFVKNRVELVISGFGEAYERSYPMLINGSHTNTNDSSTFEAKNGTVVYITLNGPRESRIMNKEKYVIKSSHRQSFGLLDFDNQYEIFYQELGIDGERIDQIRIKLFHQQDDKGKNSVS